MNESGFLFVLLGLGSFGWLFMAIDDGSLLSWVTAVLWLASWA
jgi:hypothetical protein